MLHDLTNQRMAKTHEALSKVRISHPYVLKTLEESYFPTIKGREKEYFYVVTPNYEPKVMSELYDFFEVSKGIEYLHRKGFAFGKEKLLDAICAIRDGEM